MKIKDAWARVRRFSDDLALSTRRGIGPLGFVIRSEEQSELVEAFALVIGLPAPDLSGPLQPLIDYCAKAPAIECGEGYWDDQASACGDGMRQAQSEAAMMIRLALLRLGIDAPAGLETCPDCYCHADAPGRGIDHSSQCQAAVDEDEEEGDDA